MEAALVGLRARPSVRWSPVEVQSGCLGMAGFLGGWEGLAMAGRVLVGV